MAALLASLAIVSPGAAQAQTSGIRAPDGPPPLNPAVPGAKPGVPGEGAHPTLNPAVPGARAPLPDAGPPPATAGGAGGAVDRTCNPRGASRPNPSLPACK